MSAAERSLLDQPEQRFPINLGVEIPKIRDLYEAATRNQWDPRTDVDWEQLRPESLTDQQREAARLWWSRRGWGEYGAISESPALAIRFTQQRLEADLPLFFALRTREEARHAEACYMMAERLGGYVPEPRQREFQKAVSTHGVRKMALDLDSPVEAIIGALVCGLEEYAFDWFRLMVQTTTNPTANQVLRLIMRDEVRHCAFGWHYMRQRIPHMTPAEIAVVQDAVIGTTMHVELTGYRVPWLAPESDAQREELEIDRITFEAGMGASTEEVEKPVFVDCVRRVREQFVPLGIHLPPFHHPRIGSF